MNMLKSNVVPESDGTSNPHPTETISVAPPCIDKVDIPPAKRPRIDDSLTDKLIFGYQRLSWEAVRTSTKSLVKQVNKSNLSIILRQLLQDNLIRGRGILARAIIEAQIETPINTNVYVALLSEKIAFEILDVLLKNVSSDSVKLAIAFLQECGQKLSQVNPEELDSQFSTLNNLLHGRLLTERTKDMIRVLLNVRRNQFEAYPAVQPRLNLVDENRKHTHMLEYLHLCDPETQLDEFEYDEQYEVNEKKYNQIRKTSFRNSDDDFLSSSNSSDSGDEEGDANEEKQQRIIDQTETNSITLRYKTCLTIQPNLAAEECAKKLFKMNLYRRRNRTLCKMIVDICAQQPTYEHFFGLVGEHICLLDRDFIFWFKSNFHDQYGHADRVENVKLRNLAKFFSHLLAKNSIPWSVFDGIYLTEKNTTASSCVYLKILFLELFQVFGFIKLKNHLADPTLTHYFQGFFLRDNPENARFCINFFTSIGLGRITDELREFIKSNSTPARPPPPLMSIYDEILQDYYSRHPRYEEDKQEKA